MWRSHVIQHLFQQELQEIDWITLLIPLENDPSEVAAMFQCVFDSFLFMHALLQIKKLRNELHLDLLAQ